jgi:hypothetical protein
MLPSKSLLSLILTVIFISHIPPASLAAGKNLKFPLPKSQALITPNTCRCESIVSAVIYGNTLGDKGILAQLDKGTDKISISIEGDTLYFLTGASFKTGEARPGQCQIMHNTDEQILAVCPTPTNFGFTVDTITINKKTGLAVWTKTRSADLFSGGNPSAQSFYLICK